MSAPDVSDFLLRFDNEAASFAVAQALDAVVMTEDGPRLARYTHRYGLLVCGVATAPTGETDAEGVPLRAPVPGWWVRLRVLDGSDLPADLAPFIVPESAADGLDLPVWA
jgi:hypothetical protein